MFKFFKKINFLIIILSFFIIGLECVRAEEQPNGLPEPTSLYDAGNVSGSDNSQQINLGAGIEAGGLNLNSGSPNGSGATAKPANTTSGSNVRGSSNSGTPAPGGYTPLVSDFNTGNLTNVGGKGFSGFVNKIVIGVVAGAGVLALVMVIWGGIQYISTDSLFDKKDGKKRIQAALGGLLLALSTYLILNTIDPNLTNLDLLKVLGSWRLVVMGVGGLECLMQTL